MRSQLRTHGFRFFWLVFIIALTIVPQSTFAFPQSTQGDGLRSHHRVDPWRRTILETAPTSEVIQNNAFAHLTVTPGLASIKCGFVNPDDTYEFIGIKFFLYGWDEGADQKETIEENGEFVISDREVRINTSRVIPEFEYYLLQCHNRIFNIEGQWSTLITAESRFGRIAPFNGIYERTGEVTSDRAILHTYLTEKPAPDPTGEAPLRVPPMAGHVQFRVYADPGLRKLVAKSQ